MGPPQTLVAAGMRTPARLAWRGGVASAVDVVAHRPSLWLFGMLGYLSRGGAVLLTLAILVLPTPVSVRLMLGGYLGSFGFTPDFYIVFGLALGGLAALALGAVLVSALVEVAAFERYLGWHSVERESGEVSPRLAGRERRRLVGALILLQLSGLAVLAVAALPLVLAAGQATYMEIMRPNLAGGALYDRVLAQLGEPLFLLLVALIAMEMVLAVASRRLLSRAHGLHGPVAAGPGLRRAVVVEAAGAARAGLLRPLVRPLSTLPTALLGWAAMLSVLLALGWALPLVWGSVRAEFLAGPAPERAPGMLLMAALLCVVWLGGLALAGLISAFRAALWTSEELR
jgi:hypothetical protein